MNFFIEHIQNKTNNENLQNKALSFKGIKGSGTVTELSDELFKIASAAITATGIATLGIKAKEKTENEQPKEPEVVNRHRLAKDILHIGQHSVEWHIKEGHLILNEDNKIDLNNETNKLFIENFQKGKRTKQEVFGYTPEKYEKLQKKLGKNLPLEYCLEHGLLIADEQGVIRIDNETNKEFMQKIESGEINYRSFFKSREEYAQFLEVSTISVSRAAKKEKIKVNEKTQRIDIYDPKNLEFQKNVERAKQDAKDRDLGRPVSFSEPKPTNKNPNKYTIKEFAKKLGYSQPACLTYHIKNGRIVVENGLIDITVEPNKSFYAAKLKGKLEPKPALVTREEKAKRGEKITEGTKEENPNIKTKSFVAKKVLKVSLPTLMYHIKQGHIVLRDDGKIDMSDERNKFFFENYERGVVLYPNIPVNPIKRPVKKEPEIIKNPNMINFIDLTYITGLTLWPLLQHAEKGNIIREKDGIDTNNPINKYFINRYEENCLEKLNKMSVVELYKLQNRLENRYRNLISREIYIQAKSAKNISEEDFDTYIKNTVYALFRVEILSSQELKFIEKIVKNIIDARINNKEKPEDFSDIKEFKLSGIIELEPELNIIDKLIENEHFSKSYKFDIKTINNKDVKTISNIKIDFSNFLKTQMSEKLMEKLKKIIANLRVKEEEEEIDFSKMSIEELQAKLFEFHQAEDVKSNTKLLQALEFLFGLKIETDEEKELLVTFTKALNDFIKNAADNKEFPPEILSKIHQIEESILNEENRKQARFNWAKDSMTENIKLLYDRGLTSAAEIVFNNIPTDINNEQEIRNAIYIISQINKLKSEPELPEKYKNLSNEEKVVKIEKLKKLRDIAIENTLIGFDALNSKSEYLEGAVNYSRSKYNVNKFKYVGEYIRHIRNLENGDFSIYPKFCADNLYKLIESDKEYAVNTLIKLQDWTAFTEKEKKSFTKMYGMFSKKNPIEKEILENYLENYYVNYDTTITAVGIKDKSLRIPAILTQKAKNKMVNEIARHQWVDYFEEFERAMTRIIGKDGHGGIKPYEPDGTNRTHEVAVSYPARLYCHKGKFYIFDEFVYDSHRGANS